jgi:DNA invertase Pin-like site-specific DNA recombinase
MNKFYGYIRVSTARQGQGVSLSEQRDAITRYAQRHNLEIAKWFVEMETAAKTGRPVFGEMISEINQGGARGVVIHKVDRSARNIQDWADISRLLDLGVDVHSASEGLDLHSRSGRLTADILAVVAADYVRNLREEAKKGFYGRLKQGYLPMPAPLGYVNNGAGKPKTLDPKTAPLVRKAFELYGTARYNLIGLCRELSRLGLRCRNGKPFHPSRLSQVLNNPFYMGLIHIAKTNETFQGVHEHLISPKLFQRVQDILQGKTNTRCIRHDFLYRRRLRCRTCGYSLVGERQKGYVYYRCQAQACPVTSIREEAVDEAVLEQLARLRFSADEHAWFRPKLADMKLHSVEQQEKVVAALALQLAQLDGRMNRLTDAYIDRLIEKDLLEQRKSALLVERTDVAERLAEWKAGKHDPADELLSFLERADAAYLAYKHGLPEERRDLLEALTSNRVVSGKVAEIVLKLPFGEIANRFVNTSGGPRRSTPRTWRALLKRLEQVVPEFMKDHEPEAIATRRR